MEGIKRITEVTVFVIGLFISYKIDNNAFQSFGHLMAFLGMGSLIGLLLWLPAKYVLRGFDKSAAKEKD